MIFRASTPEWLLVPQSKVQTYERQCGGNGFNSAACHDCEGAVMG
jgi:hypothetical protein